MTRHHPDQSALPQTGAMPVGTVIDLAFKTARGGPMLRAASVTAVAGHGIAEGPPSSPRRELTLLSAEQWRQVTRQLGTDLPWHTRRANLLVDAASLEHLIGRTICIGPVVVRILGETKPCNVMDDQYPGLRSALEPECRGGVHGRICVDGMIRVGDAVLLLDDGKTSGPTGHPSD